MSSSPVLQTATLKLTNQEQNIINYLSGKKSVAWQELAQFAKDPTTVKKQTLQKVVSDIKRKYIITNIPMPFDCSFTDLSKPIIEEIPIVESYEPKEQTFVKLVRTPERVTVGGNRVPLDNTDPDAVIDFKLDRNYRRVKTRTNIINLCENDWDIFCYLLDNVGKMVTIEDIRDKVLYKGWGSKTPYTWSTYIKGRIGSLRSLIPELKRENRLITVAAQGNAPTSYMLK
jgi:hypothetical protein